MIYLSVGNKKSNNVNLSLLSPLFAAQNIGCRIKEAVLHSGLNNRTLYRACR